jgi:glucan-binding YG repeat protein
MYTAASGHGDDAYSVNCLEAKDVSDYELIAIDIWLGGDDYVGDFGVVFGFTETFYHLARTVTTTDNGDGTTTETVTYSLHEDGAWLYRDNSSKLEGTWKNPNNDITANGKTYKLWTRTLEDGTVEYYGRLWEYNLWTGRFDNMNAGWNTIYIPLSSFSAGFREAVTQVGFTTTGWSLNPAGSEFAKNKANYRYAFGDVKVVNLGTYLEEATTGWIDGKLYIESTQPVTGWQDYDGSRYYFDAAGNMFTGKKTVDGLYYEFSENGVLVGLVNGIETVTVGEQVYNEETKQNDWTTFEVDRIYVDGEFLT